MKKITLLLLLFIITDKIFAQQDIYVYGLGTALWNPQKEVADQKLKFNSPFIQVFTNVQLWRPKLSLGIGAGFISYNAFLNNVMTIDTDQHLGFTNYDIPGLKKYKLNTSYVEVPFEIRYRQNPNKHKHQLRVAAGFKVSYLVSHHTKVKYVKSQSPNKAKEYGIKYLEDINYGPQVRIAYGNLGLYACYNLVGLFDVSQSPLINQGLVALCFCLNKKKNNSPIPNIPFRLKPQESASVPDLILKQTSNH